MVTFAKSELKKYALTMYLVLLDENIDHKLYKYNKPKKKQGESMTQNKNIRNIIVYTVVDTFCIS